MDTINIRLPPYTWFYFSFTRSGSAKITDFLNKEGDLMYLNQSVEHPDSVHFGLKMRQEVFILK